MLPTLVGTKRAVYPHLAVRALLGFRPSTSTRRVRTVTVIGRIRWRISSHAHLYHSSGQQSRGSQFRENNVWLSNIRMDDITDLPRFTSFASPLSSIVSSVSNESSLYQIVAKDGESVSQRPSLASYSRT